MATPRSNTLRPSVGKNAKTGSMWDKIGTLGRRKQEKEATIVMKEGRESLQSETASFENQPQLTAQFYALDEGEERSMVDPRAYSEPRFADLRRVLLQWLNDCLTAERIIVVSLEDDLCDGYVLHKLIEKLSGVQLEVPELTQLERVQKHKLNVVLTAANRLLGLSDRDKKLWTVEDVHSKSTLAIVHLLVALARHVRAPVRLPDNVHVRVVIVKKVNGHLVHRMVEEEITSKYDDFGLRYEPDAFDTLVDQDPDNLGLVRRSLLMFINKHLNKLNLDVSELESQLADGVYLCLLLGVLNGYFVPQYQLHMTASSQEERVANVQLAFELMQDAGLPEPKPRPEDIANGDVKSILRVVYNLFAKYKELD